MKSKLVQTLEDLRNKSKVIKGYEVSTTESKSLNNRSEVTVELKVGGITLVTKSKIYNPEMTKFSKVSDTLFDELEQQLMEIGVMALYSNKLENGR